MTKIIKNNPENSKNRILIGKNLRLFRKKYKSNQVETAKIMCVSQAAMSRYENGDFTLTLEHILNLSSGFKISVDKVVKFLCKPLEVKG